MCNSIPNRRTSGQRTGRQSWPYKLGLITLSKGVGGETARTANQENYLGALVSVEGGHEVSCPSVGMIKNINIRFWLQGDRRVDK